MLIAKVASVLTTNRLPLPPASTIHHADCFGVVVSKLCGIDLVFFELTKLFQNRDGLSAGSNGVFIVSLGKYFLCPITRQKFDEFDGVCFVRCCV